jgi:hypothetical protein
MLFFDGVGAVPVGTVDGYDFRISVGISGKRKAARRRPFETDNSAALGD